MCGSPEYHPYLTGSIHRSSATAISLGPFASTTTFCTRAKYSGPPVDFTVYVPWGREIVSPSARYTCF